MLKYLPTERLNLIVCIIDQVNIRYKRRLLYNECNIIILFNNNKNNEIFDSLV